MKVLKNIERYVYIEKSQLLNELNHQIVRRKGKTAYFKSIENFGQFIKRNKYLLKKNQKKVFLKVTSISAVLANVYMIDFDKKVCALLKNLGGMYRRYSDDFIIVIPKEKVNRLEFSNIFKKIISLSSTLLHLDIEKEKTRRLSIKYGIVKDLQKEKCSATTSSLDYLGFIYQNNTVSFRGKTIYKFYYRGRRALESASAGKEAYDVITKYLKGDYKVSDDAANNVLAILYPSGMSASEKQKNY
jgi:Reverse transcriptase (RNA-dependent DNA polymerase).